MSAIEGEKRIAGAAIEKVLDTSVRPDPPGPLANVLTFAWRGLLKIKHMPEQMFDAVITPVMFTVMFTYLFGGALAGSTEAYLQFLLPGILVQTVMFATIYTGFTLNTDLGKGVYDRFRSLPVWRLSPIMGAMVADLQRHTISAIIVFLIGLIMGFRPETGLLGMVIVILLLDVFALGFTWIFVTVGLVVRSSSSVMTMSWFFLMPITFGSNIFVDTATMPQWLQSVIAFNPVAHLTTAARGILDGTVDASQIGLALIAPAVLTVIFAPLSLYLYSRKG